MSQQISINSFIELAKKWQNSAIKLVRDFDKKFYVKMNNMLDHPKDKSLLTELPIKYFRCVICRSKQRRYKNNWYVWT